MDHQARGSNTQVNQGSTSVHGTSARFRPPVYRCRGSGSLPTFGPAGAYSQLTGADGSAKIFLACKKTCTQEARGGRRKSLKRKPIHQLSRRERQIMEIIYQLGQGTAADVAEAMPDAPGYSSVRAMLRILEEKKLLRHRQEGPRYVYLPTVPRATAMRSAMRHVVQTFFDGSTEGAVAALLEMDAASFSAEELDRLKGLIDKAREEGR
ncbi:MAG: BlaI/MecI/CopY family transcriptional regulator [Acidobacteria bacterium]|nr:MAG: BlaI/MecI/CopY family transcriptional regulator [Acidobacteriota bacterium]